MMEAVAVLPLLPWVVYINPVGLLHLNSMPLFLREWLLPVKLEEDWGITVFHHQVGRPWAILLLLRCTTLVCIQAIHTIQANMAVYLLFLLLPE